MNRRRAASIVLAGAVLFAACGNDTDSGANRAEVLKNLSTDVYAPAYAQLDGTAQALATAAKRLCDAPQAAQLAAARTAWTRAWSAWNRTRAFRFGPVTDTRANADIAFMVDPAKIDKAIATGTNAGEKYDAESLAVKGADARGLGAVEHALFGDDALDPATCAYAEAASELAAQAANKAKVAWVDGVGDVKPFRDQLAKPGNDTYVTEQGAVGDIVNGLSMALTETARELANAEGAPPGERETAGTHGGSQVRDAIGSVRAAYFGTNSGTKGDGISDLVAAVSDTTDERVTDLVVRADKAVAALPASLADASPAELTNAYRLVSKLGTIVRAEVASELGVTLSLGDADGDS